MIDKFAMSPIKVQAFIGTRPEAIKMAPLAIALEADRRFNFKLCLTGQHSEMLHQALEAFDLKIDADLELMRPDQTLASLSAKIIEGASLEIGKFKPELVLVHGDTTTALSVAIAAFYLGVPVAHVESGLRTHNIQSPFPEEFNRQTIARIASLNFAPTEMSKKNLLDEGIDPSKIFVTGNTIVDAANLAIALIDSKPELRKEISHELNSKLGFDPNLSPFVIVTQHRRENLGSGLDSVLEAVAEFASKNKDKKIIFPVHLNPRVRQAVTSSLSTFENISLCEPLSYLPFTWLIRNCLFLISDSGGIQEEAIGLGKHVIVTRESTERSEGLGTGFLHLTGTSRTQIESAITRLIERKNSTTENSYIPNPYGDGNASQKIISKMLDFIKGPDSAAATTN